MVFHSGARSALKEASKNNVIKEKGIKLFRIKEANVALYDKDNCVIYCIPDKKYEYLNFILQQLQIILGITFEEEFDLEKHSSIIYNEYLSEIKNNNVAQKFPEIVEEWDYAKNKNLKPEYFLPDSNKKVWWKCSKCGSSYFADISHRTKGTGCPYCSGKKVNNTNSFSSKFPELLKFWDYSKNTIKPDNIYFSSRKKVWWICEKCGNSYRAAICQRIKTKTNYCFDCFHNHIGLKNRNIAIKKSGSVFDNKLLIVDWDYSKNDFSPKDVPQTSGEYVYWKCNKCGFEWRAKINNRTHGTGCPKCRGKESCNNRRKAVEQYNMEGVLIQTFDSVRNAINITHDQNLTKCLNGTMSSSKGFIYKYKMA